MLIKKSVLCPYEKRKPESTRALSIFDQDKTHVGLRNKRENRE